MKLDLVAWISQPMYAGGIAAVLTIAAKYMDNRMSDTKGTFLGYVKAALFSAALVAFWVWLLSKVGGSDRQSSNLSGGSGSEYAGRSLDGGYSGYSGGSSGGYSGGSSGGYSGGSSGGYSGGSSGGYSGAWRTLR